MCEEVTTKHGGSGGRARGRSRATSLSPPLPITTPALARLLRERRPLKGPPRFPAARVQVRRALSLDSGSSRVRRRRAQPRGPIPPLRPHASALGAAILPLPLARPSTGVNSDFQHKTKMAVEASGECPDENASNELGPAPMGTVPRSLNEHTPEELPLTSSGDKAWTAEGG